MRDNLEKYIADGGNVAFFSGNTCCWQVRSEDDGRSLTCWKQWYNVDPLYRQGDHKLLSTTWSHHLVGRPENQLTGVGFLWGGYHRSHGQFMDGPASFIVHRPDHWLFEGTDLKRDDRFGGKDTIVGYECDGCEMTWQDGLPFPTDQRRNTEVLHDSGHLPGTLGTGRLPVVRPLPERPRRCSGAGSLHSGGHRGHGRHDRLGSRTARQRSGGRENHAKRSGSPVEVTSTAVKFVLATRRKPVPLRN